MYVRFEGNKELIERFKSKQDKLSRLTLTRIVKNERSRRYTSSFRQCKLFDTKHKHETEPFNVLSVIAPSFFSLCFFFFF